MDSILLEVLVICLMIVLNGFFACSEFAIVSVRKSRIARLVLDGDERARIVETLLRVTSPSTRRLRNANAGSRNAQASASGTWPSATAT